MRVLRVIAEVVMEPPVNEIFPLHVLISLVPFNNEDKHSSRWLFQIAGYLQTVSSA